MRAKDKFLKKGTTVKVSQHRSLAGKGLNYPDFVGVLLEDCNGTGWDVVDVALAESEPESVYSFDVSAVTL